MKKVKRYLLLLALASTGLFAGYSWLEDVVQDAFISVASDQVSVTIRNSAEDRLKEKLFDLFQRDDQ